MSTLLLVSPDFCKRFSALLIVSGHPNTFTTKILVKYNRKKFGYIQSKKPVLYRPHADTSLLSFSLLFLEIELRT